MSASMIQEYPKLVPVLRRSAPRDFIRRNCGGMPMRYFDYEKLARQTKIPARKLARLRAVVRREFPEDDMLFELHMLRVCMSIRDGRITIDRALAEKADAAAVS